jgi:hypothetical protein
MGRKGKPQAFVDPKSYPISCLSKETDSQSRVPKTAQGQSRVKDISKRGHLRSSGELVTNNCV